MLFSAFTPCDMLDFSAGPNEAEVVYDSMIANLGGQYDPGGGPPAIGTRQEALVFMQAMQIGRARKTLRLAADQRLPGSVFESLPQREAEYGISPGPFDSIATRRANIAARKRLSGGGTRLNIESSLRALLGTDFIAYRTTTIAESPSTAQYPQNCGDWPMNLQRSDVARKSVRMLEPVAFTGTLLKVAYALVAARTGGGVAALDLSVGDVLVFDVGRSGQQDRITVGALGVKPFGPSGFNTPYISATFTRPHETGCVGYTHPLPSWVSWKRHSLICLTPSAATDPVKRAKVDELMSRLARSVSTWDIVESSATQTNLFQIDAPGIGTKTIATVTL